MLERTMHGYASAHESKNCCSRCLVVFTAQVAGFLLPSPGCSFTNFRLKHRGLPRPAIFFLEKSSRTNPMKLTGYEIPQTLIATNHKSQLKNCMSWPWLAGLTSSHRRMIIVKTTSYSSQNYRRRIILRSAYFRIIFCVTVKKYGRSVTVGTSVPLWRGGPNTRTWPTVLLTPPASKAADMAHLCVPQNQALGVCRGFVPDIQVCSTHGSSQRNNHIQRRGRRLTWNPRGKRKWGRPRSTWRCDLEAEAKMGYMWWQLERLAQDRDAWRALVSSLCSSRGQR